MNEDGAKPTEDVMVRFQMITLSETHPLPREIVKYLLSNNCVMVNILNTSAPHSSLLNISTVEINDNAGFTEAFHLLNTAGTFMAAERCQ